MQDSASPIIHNFDSKSKEGMAMPLFFCLVVVVIVVGVSVGFVLMNVSKKSSGTMTGANGQKVAKTAGIVDKSTFKDSAEGVLKEGGVDGEGSYHLDRPGGASQNVYLTSSTVDLLQYVGKKVKVYGQTFQAQKAGWLMDVGLIEVQ